MSPLSKIRGFGVYAISKKTVLEENVHYKGKCGKMSEELLSIFSAPSQAPLLTLHRPVDVWNVDV